MTDFIGVDVAGLDELQSLLANLPEDARNAVVEDVSDYLLNVFRLYPPYNYITRKAAYGQTFVSDKQRRYVMARIREGTMTPGTAHRTQATAKAWRKIGQGYNILLANESLGARYTMGDETQAAQTRMAGWKTTGQIVKERMGRINEIAEAAAKKAIKKLDK